MFGCFPDNDPEEYLNLQLVWCQRKFNDIGTFEYIMPISSIA